MLISIAVSLVNGTGEKLASALADGANEGVKLALSIAGIMAFWTGIMKVAEASGFTNVVAKVFSPLIGRLIPEAKKDKKVCSAVTMNMTANFFGMGNAATPLGLNAMKKLHNYSDKTNATNSMCMLAVINCASIQLIPSTLMAVRSAMESRNPGEIIVPIWIVSILTFATGVLLCKIFGRKK